MYNAIRCQKHRLLCVVIEGVRSPMRASSVGFAYNASSPTVLPVQRSTCLLRLLRLLRLLALLRMLCLLCLRGSGTLRSHLSVLRCRTTTRRSRSVHPRAAGLLPLLLKEALLLLLKLMFEFDLVLVLELL